ncbi:MAG: GNAT family N-acetyltransferase [Chloroflexota bacterium]|nr:MAG: GNAT family N-acetyltransferase [Chloroflexota bacterium]
MARDATRDDPPFRTLVAEVAVDGSTTLVGYAVYFFTYSTFLAQPTLYLEDIFVDPDHRGRGAGRALFAACAREAAARECGRMEWQVLDWNEPAIAFYKRSGARVHPEWRLCRLTGDELAAAGA